MNRRWGAALIVLFMVFLTACNAATTPVEEGGSTIIPTTAAEGAGLVETAVQEVNTEGVEVGSASVTIAGETPSNFTAMAAATDLGEAGWQINVLDTNGGGTIQLSLPKNMTTGVYEVVRAAEAMGTNGFTKAAVEMITGQGAEMQMMDIEGGQLRVQSASPLTAELTFTVPTAEGGTSNVTVILNQVPL